jgi:hypothetical protein
MSQLAGFEGDYTIQTPRKVQKQIVNGVNYKFILDVVYRGANGKYEFKSCNLYIFDQPWTNTRNFVEAPVCSAQQQKQTGGWTQVTQVTDDILEVAQLTAKAMTSQLGFAGEHNVVKVENVQRQIVAGVNYKFTIEYLVSNNDHTYMLKSCDLQVNHQSWNNNKITFLAAPVCRQLPSLRQMLVGGWTQTNVITDEMMSLASWATSQLSAFTGVSGEHTVMTLRNMQTQVVSGINYKFTVDVLAQDSSNGKYSFKSCDLFINYRAWTNTKTFVEEPKCGNNPNFQ